MYNKDFNIVSFTTTKPKCFHNNGWFKSVTFKWWIFNFRKRFFLCTDCEDLIPIEEFEEIQKLKNESGGKDMPSCLTCYYSENGKHSCDRHVNKLKPDYSKGVECAYNNYAHYRSYELYTKLNKNTNDKS